MTFSALQGFRDYLPPEAGARAELFRRMRSSARRAGFSELETPSVESLELFQVKSGEEIGRELWTFQDKGKRHVALAAETTPSLARVFANRAKSEPLPVKWFTISKLWRYEEPQSGRTREFSQFNLDILGVAGVEAEVELLATAALLLDEAGATGLYEFRINDRALVEGIGQSLGARDLPRYFRALDRSRKTSRTTLSGELEAAGLSDASVRRLEADLDVMASGLSTTEALAWLSRLDPKALTENAARGIDRLRRIIELLPSAGIADRAFLDLAIVRGFDYYTSTVFEAFDRKGERRSLFGGGRYDGLVELFDGPPTPACGLALGDQTLELLLKSNGRWPDGEPPLDTYVVALSKEMIPVAFEIVRRLRAGGQDADLDLLGRSVSRQMREAARRKARRAILVGAKELERGMVVERDLTTGSQRELPREAPDGRAPPRAPA